MQGSSVYYLCDNIYLRIDSKLPTSTKRSKVAFKNCVDNIKRKMGIPRLQYYIEQK